jgi:rhamnogalacturonan endolyase
VGVNTSGSNVFLSWRVLGTDASTTTFNIYRNGTKINSSAITVSNYIDTAGSTAAIYSVRPVVGGVEQRV